MRLFLFPISLTFMPVVGALLKLFVVMEEKKKITPLGSHNESTPSDSQNIRQGREKQISSDNRKISPQTEKGKTRRKRKK